MQHHVLSGILEKQLQKSNENSDSFWIALGSSTAAALSKKCRYHTLKLSFILLPRILMLEEHFIYRVKI